MPDAVELLEESLQEEAALNKLKAIASEFDVADEAEDAEEMEKETRSSRR